MLPRLLDSRYRVHSVLASEPARDALAPLLEAHPDLTVHVAPADVITSLTGYDFHRGCLALGYREEFDQVGPSRLALLDEAEPGKSNPVAVVLEAVSNPDNIGGIFRSAHAFGARAVLLGSACGDPLYRKAIRTSMGATLQVPWTELAAWPDDLRALRERGYRLVALTPDPAAPLLRDVIAQAPGPVAFLLGSEGHGLSPAALAYADITARIPMAREDADSLNVAAAASIALYEAGNR